MQGVFHDITHQVERQERLEQDASTDPLTGLANRRQLDEFLSEELARARRDETPLSLLLLDLDHFKAINDTHGQAAGDALLTQVAASLLEASRDADLVARCGGEEFAVVLPRTAAEGALQAAERCRARIKNTRVLWEGRILQVRVSVGVATLASASHLGAAELLAEADRGLYDAKRSRRDTIRRAADEAA